MEPSQLAPTIDYSSVAALYDEYVKVDFDIPFFVEAAHQAGGPVLELMAGTGRVTLPLARVGIPVTCVDISPAMLSVLQAKLAAENLQAEVIPADVRTLALGRQFRLVIIPFNAFSEFTSLEDQQRALEAIYRHVAPDGTFICTLHNPAVRLKRIDGQLRLWTRTELSGQGGTFLLWGLESIEAASGLVLGIQMYEIYNAEGQLLSRRTLQTRFRLPTRLEFEALAQAAGFSLSALYGDYSQAPFDATSSPFMIFLLNRS